jgi:hypothetical protein
MFTLFQQLLALYRTPIVMRPSSPAAALSQLASARAGLDPHHAQELR